MGYKLYPIEITCNATLSTVRSDWGASDGIRFYVLVTTSGGFYQLMISGREFPPPDFVDSYYFVPGTQLDLSQYPPQGAPNWNSNDLVLGPSDFMSLVLLGINEGLPYFGGGGGNFGGSAAQSGLYDAEKSAAAKLADAALQAGTEGVGSIATDGVLEAFKTVIDQLNSTDDCRGVAFAHGVVLNRKTLLYHTLTSRSFQLDPMVDEVGLATALQVKQGCGQPDYDVPVRLWRTFDFALDFTKTETAAQHLSNDIPVPPVVKMCPTQGPLLTWLEADDYEIEVVPSVWYSECSPYWTVNGIPLREDSGTVAVPVVTTIYHEQGNTWTPQNSQQNVTVDYEQLQDPDGTTHLRLATHGTDGDYSLTVGVNFNFEGTYDNNQPVGDTEVVSANVDVAGQVWTGNAAYQAYIKCLDERWADITHRLFGVSSRWLGAVPPGPVDVGAVEKEVTMVSALLEQVVSRIGGQAGAAQG
jgi:hypothetical protein